MTKVLRENLILRTNISNKIRDIGKIYIRNYININIFGNEDKEKFPIYISKNTFKRDVLLLFIEKEANLTMLLSKILRL